MKNRIAIDRIKDPASGVTLHKVVSQRILIAASKSGLAVWVDNAIAEVFPYSVRGAVRRAERYADRIHEQHSR